MIRIDDSVIPSVTESLQQADEVWQDRVLLLIVQARDILDHYEAGTKVTNKLLKLMKKKGGPLGLCLISSDFAPELARAAARKNQRAIIAAEF